MSQKRPALIGAVFGLIFVFANVGFAPTIVATALRILAVLGFLVVLLTGRRETTAATASSDRGTFGRGYWAVVAGEFAAIALGIALLKGTVKLPQAAPAWIAFVVGAHFVVLALVWKMASIRWLGAALMACGTAGLAMAAAGAAAGTISLTAGVLPGGVLLGFVLMGSTWRPARPVNSTS